MIQQLTLPTPYAVGDVNTFLVKGDSLSLFDTGPRTPKALAILEKEIANAGYRMEDIEQVFLTHHHPDHSGWADGFPNAILYGHEYNNLWLTRNAEFIDYHEEFYMNLFIEQGVPEKSLIEVKKMKKAADYIAERPLDVLLKEGDSLPGLPGWTAMETFGHSQSHLSFLNSAEKKMIGGDLLIAKVSSNPIIEPPLNPEDGRPKALLQYNHSLKRLQEEGIDIVYSGHGEPVTNVHSLITKRLGKQHDRAMKVFHMLENGPKSVYELTVQLFPTAYVRELGLTLSETLGQLDYLLQLGRIHYFIDEKGIYHYEQA